MLSHQHGDGHYGLPGMRERATLIGGKLTVWSEVDAGTGTRTVDIRHCRLHRRPESFLVVTKACRKSEGLILEKS